jgi:hypothetical protein
MACIKAKSLLLFAVCFCLFTTGKTQLPPWFGQLGNLNNGTLSGLLKQLSANASWSDILKQLNMNSTDRQSMLKEITKRLGMFDLPSLLQSVVMDGLKSIPLGQCGRDLQRIRNNTVEMVACKFLVSFCVKCLV